MFQVVAKKLKICLQDFILLCVVCHRYVNAGLLFRPIEIMNYNNLGSLYLQNAYTSFLSANVTVYTSNC